MIFTDLIKAFKKFKKNYNKPGIKSANIDSISHEYHMPGLVYIWKRLQNLIFVRRHSYFCFKCVSICLNLHVCVTFLFTIHRGQKTVSGLQTLNLLMPATKRYEKINLGTLHKYHVFNCSFTSYSQESNFHTQFTKNKYLKSLNYSRQKIFFLKIIRSILNKFKFYIIFTY